MDSEDGVCVCGHEDCRISLKASCKTKLFDCRWNGCNRKDMALDQLKDHVEAKHISKNTTGLTCQWEGCTTSGAWKKDYELKKHLNDKHHHHGYDCEWKDCKFSCCFSSQLLRHLEDYHIGKRNKQYKCEWQDCDYETKNKKRSELVSHISKHHNHIYLFCLRCNEGFCRQQDFTRHDKNYADNAQNQSATKCAKTLPLRTPTKEESYSDCNDIPQTVKTPSRTPVRKKLASEPPAEASTSFVKEEYSESWDEGNSTWVKEEEVDDSYVKDEPEDEDGDDSYANEKVYRYPDRDINTILQTLNIREPTDALTRSPGGDYHNPYNPAEPSDFPSPRRSPSPSPSHNPFSSPSKGWGGPSNHISPSKFLSFSDHSSPSDANHHQSAPPSPFPYAASPSSPPTPPRETESEPSYYPSPSSTPPSPQFRGISPLSSPAIFNSPGGYFNIYDHPSPRPHQFDFGNNSPSPSHSGSYGGYQDVKYSPLIEHSFSREASPFHQAASPSPQPSFSNRVSYSNAPSPMGSFLVRTPSSPGYLQQHSNPGSPYNPPYSQGDVEEMNGALM